MKSLVGYTGFVGSNICANENFEGLYDSKNVQTAYGTNPDLLIYSGVPAQKFIANQFPEKDFEVIENAINNIKQINPKQIVLISTIDVYKNPAGVNEDTVIDTNELQPYGKNRYYLEQWVMQNMSNYLIVHLPGLYGKNIKKNFIYDLINIIPSMLKKEKFEELSNRDSYIKDFYVLQENGFYKLVDNIGSEDREKLKKHFEALGFSALNFTDSRASYQFYNLSYLYGHIQKALENNIRVLNLAVEPITVKELYAYIKGKEFKNEILKNNIPNYDFKTKYSEMFGGKNGYILEKDFILEDIKKFVENSK